MDDADRYPERKSVRLPGYNYSQPNWFFITLCAHSRKCLFGRIDNGEMHPTDIGRLIIAEWNKSFLIRKELDIDCWVLMPNHLHAVVLIKPGPESSCTQQAVPSLRPRSLSSFVAGFKAGTTKAINQQISTAGQPIWQRSFWEHVIRTEEALYNIRQYILNNPLAWMLDHYNPDFTKRTGSGLSHGADSSAPVHAFQLGDHWLAQALQRDQAVPLDPDRI